MDRVVAFQKYLTRLNISHLRQRFCAVVQSFLALPASRTCPRAKCAYKLDTNRRPSISVRQFLLFSAILSGSAADQRFAAFRRSVSLRTCPACWPKSTPPRFTEWTLRSGRWRSTAAHGDPKILIVGLPDTAVKESRDRVTTAIGNSGFRWPRGRTTVNLAPADIKKEGPSFDLPIALGMIAVTEEIDSSAVRSIFLSSVNSRSMARSGR